MMLTPEEKRAKEIQRIHERYGSIINTISDARRAAQDIVQIFGASRAVEILIDAMEFNSEALLFEEDRSECLHAMELMRSAVSAHQKERK